MRSRPLPEAILVYGRHESLPLFKMWASAHVTTASFIRWLPHIILCLLQMETVTKILIKMHPLSTDGAIQILVSGLPTVSIQRTVDPWSYMPINRYSHML